MVSKLKKFCELNGAVHNLAVQSIPELLAIVPVS